MFASIRPEPHLLYEHVFCSLAPSTLAQRARNALSLTRSFLLLEDDDPVDWEVDREDRLVSEEPTWARAHRRQLCGRRAVRRRGQTPARPQVCICPIDRAGDGRRAGMPAATPTGDATESACQPLQRGSRITTGSSRLAIDL
jgi:hypothetical protein